MAPFVGPSRRKILFLLRWLPFYLAWRLPVTLGMGSPMAMITREGGLWRVRALVVDVEASKALAEEHRRTGQPFVPEMTSASLSQGTILAESASARGLASQLATLAGPWFDFTAA
jgi:hypothetical protein